MIRPWLLRLLALATLACCLAVLVLVQAAKRGTSGPASAGPVRPADPFPARAVACSRPAAAPTASPAPPTSLEAVCTVELLCRLAGSGRRAAARRLLCTPQAWPLKNMQALAGMRFASARVATPAQAGRLRLRVRVRTRTTAGAAATRVLVFVLRAGQDGWRAASVRPVGSPRADAPPR